MGCRRAETRPTVVTERCVRQTNPLLLTSLSGRSGSGVVSHGGSDNAQAHSGLFRRADIAPARLTWRPSRWERYEWSRSSIWLFLRCLRFYHTLASMLVRPFNTAGPSETESGCFFHGWAGMLPGDFDNRGRSNPGNTARDLRENLKTRNLSAGAQTLPKAWVPLLVL